MAVSVSVAIAAANGDFPKVKEVIRNGADVNARSREGMTPLAISSFWGYAEITELLLKAGADINLSNKGTKWTPLHCAAFQGHGKVIMKLMAHNPDLYAKDNQGRTPVDFASALDSIWAFFAATGCKRTPKSDLISMNIVKKVVHQDPAIPKSDFIHFSRPGSAYIMNEQPMYGDLSHEDKNMAIASMNGDVLAGVSDEVDTVIGSRRTYEPSFSIWRR